MPLYVGNTSNLARNVKDIYVGNSSSQARRVLTGYIGNSNNQAQKFYEASRNRWVVVGNNGFIATSTDNGNNWQSSYQGGFHLRGIDYGNGKWIAAGADQIIATSTDGINWTLRYDVGSGWSIIWETVKFANNTWMLGGGASSTYVNEIHSTYSYDNGETWDRCYHMFPGKIEGLCYNNDRWVGAGSNKRINDNNSSPSMITTTTSGLFNTWPQMAGISSQGSGVIHGIDYGNGRWIAVGTVYDNPNTGFIYSSTDGLTWTRTNMSNNGNLWSGMTDIKFHNGRWMIVGQNGLIRTSTNGTSWTLNPIGSAMSLNAIDVNNNGLWMATGYRSNGQGIIVTSNDNGTTWSSMKDVPGASSMLNDIVWA